MNCFSSISALSTVFFPSQNAQQHSKQVQTLSELSFSWHFWSPAGSSGGAAAINDFFGHLDKKIMLLAGLISESVYALVVAAYYLWYEKKLSNTKVMAKNRIICHSQFKSGRMIGSCLERVLGNQIVSVLMQVTDIIVKGNSLTCQRTNKSTVHYLCHGQWQWLQTLGWNDSSSISMQLPISTLILWAHGGSIGTVS